MPFPPIGLSEALTAELEGFIHRNDFVDLYRSYSWRNDNYTDGLCDILSIEAMLTESDRNGGISLEDLRGAKGTLVKC